MSKPSLRERLKQAHGTMWTAGAYDALSARIIQDAGFDAVFVSGYGLSAGYLGKPDVELLTLTENAAITRNICAVTSVPVVVDIDTAYGGPVNAIRTMSEMERAGVAAVIVEDQVMPKTCPKGLPNDITLLSATAAARKIQALCDAREDPDTVVIARTDAPDIDEAIRRCRQYRDAGADLVQATSRALHRYEDIEELRDGVGARVSLQVLGWMERGLTAQQIESVASLACYTFTPLMSAAHAMFANLRQLAHTRSMDALPLPTCDTAEFGDFIGFGEVAALRERYAE